MSCDNNIFNENYEEMRDKSLTAFIRDMERQKLKEQILRKYTVYLAHPEAIKIATQSLTPEQRKYNVFVPNKYIKKDKMAVLKDEETKLRILIEMGLIKGWG